VPEPTPVTASMIFNTGIVLVTLGRHEEGLAAMREALALWERLLPPGHARIASAHTGIGRTLREMGALAESLEHHDRALAMLEREVRQAEPIAGDPLLQAAKTALRAAQRERADAWIEQGLRLYATTPNPVMVGSFRFLRAQSLQQQGLREQAAEEARAALGLLRGADERTTREIETWLAEHGRVAGAAP
jgi:tetratricopeptide (TPR) repeat protein